MKQKYLEQKIKLFLTVLLLVTLLTLSSSLVFAQSDESTLHVTVIERVGSSEMAITNAKVTLDFGTITGERSSVGTVDTSSGEAVFFNLNPGVYTISVKAPGYTSSQKEFIKEAGKAGRLTIALEKALEGATGSIKIELKRIAPQTPAPVRNGKIEILKGGEVIRSSGVEGKEVLFSDLPVGKYTARATAPGYAPETKEFEIEADVENWLGIILEPVQPRYEVCPKDCTCDDQMNIIECHGLEVAGKGVEITNITCDAMNPCPKGMDLGCYSFPGLGLRCAKKNPCSYYKCPEGTECEVTESYPGQVICSGKCEGEYCEAGVSYNAITGKVEIMRGDKKESIGITIRTAPGYKGILETPTVSAKVSGELVIEESKLLMKTSAGKKPVNIMPEDAITVSATPDKKSIKEIDLKEESQKPVYSVKGTKQAKILFLIPVSMEVETKIDAEMGNIISINKPWWSFLTF